MNGEGWVGLSLNPAIWETIAATGCLGSESWLSLGFG